MLLWFNTFHDKFCQEFIFKSIWEEFEITVP